MRQRLHAAMTLTVLAACGGQQTTTPAAPTPAGPAASATSAPTGQATVSAAPPAPPPPLAELEKKALSAWYAAFNAHDTKGLAALYASDAVAAATGPGGWVEQKGPDAIVGAYAPVFGAMPDLKAAPVRVFQKKDTVIVEWAASGTNTGPLMGGAPTNKKAAVWGASVFSFNPDGFIVREEGFHDQATILQQLGKMPGKARDLATLPAGDPTFVTAAGTPDEDKLVDQMKATWPATWNKRDPKAYAEVITDDALHSEVASPNDYKGKEANVKECAMYSKALPDMTTTIDKAWAFAPNFIVSEFTFTGTMKGPIGPFKATNKPVTIHGLDVDELKDGKLQKGVTYSNGMELLAALGVLPKPAPAGKPADDAKPPKK